eukprot:3845072-Pleurochrysis_carterae.AAC.3
MPERIFAFPRSDSPHCNLDNDLWCGIPNKASVLKSNALDSARSMIRREMRADFASTLAQGGHHKRR